MKIDWTTVLAVAAHHVNEETWLYSVPPTLRRCHYLLVSDAEARAAGYVNTQGCYKQLSSRTARLRDSGEFPSFTDRGRSIEYADGDLNLGERLKSEAKWFRLNRSIHLPVKVVLLVEKDGVVPLLQSRFNWLDVSASKGYTSVTHADDLARLKDRERETVGIYLGDYDPSGLDVSEAEQRAELLELAERWSA